jgi:hypothetical protein
VSSTNADDEPVEDAMDGGRLTPEEKAAVMLDLRPKALLTVTTEAKSQKLASGMGEWTIPSTSSAG